MTRDTVGVVLQHLQALAAGSVTEGQSDQHLLERFVRDRDGAAFAALLERHGPMVLGIGRRALRDEQLAEDVLQATFLVLARSATTIRKTPSLVGWLHGVAVRLARKAKAEVVRAGRGDTRTGAVSSPGPVVEVSWREVQQILDDELQRLPERYRLPLILCHLEGRTRDEAAARLGYPLGRLKGLLERGRERLRARLIRRGLAPAAGATALLTETALAAPVPPLLAVATLRSALRLGAGERLRACGVSDTVIRLTERGLRVMGSKKLVLVLVFALGLGGLCVGAVLVTNRSDPTAPPENAREVAVAPLDREEVPMRVKNGEAPRADEHPRPDVAADPLPVGAALRFGSSRLQDGYREACFSPDGKLLATAGNNQFISVWDVATGKRVETLSSCGTVRDLRWKSDGKITATVVFGREWFLMQEFVPGKKADPNDQAKFDEKIRAVEQQTAEEIQARGRIYTRSLSLDGQWAIVIRNSAEKPVQWTEVYRFTPGETSETAKPVARVDAASGSSAWLSGDGKVLLSYVGSLQNQPGQIRAFNVTPEGGGKLAWTLPLPGNDRSALACFSPHGKEVAIHFSNGAVELWDGLLGKRIREFPKVSSYLHHNSSVESGRVVMSADGKRLALLYRNADGAVGGRIVDVQTGKDHCTLRPSPMPPFGFGICFSPDGGRVALVGSGVVRVWNADTGADACPLPGHRGGVTSLAVVDDKTVVTTGADLTVRAWNPTTGAELWHTELTDQASIAFATPDGVVLTQDYLWNMEKLAFCIDPVTGRKKPLPGQLGEAKRIYPLAVAPDGKRVATLALDHKNPTWEVWSWPAGERLVQLPVQPPGKFQLNRCAQAHFSPDGRQLVAVVYYDDPAEQQVRRQVPAHPFIERWDLATKKLLDQSKSGVEDRPHLLPSSKDLWSWTAGTEIRDALTGRLVVKLQFPENEKIAVHPSWAAAISTDGAWLAIGDSPFGASLDVRILVFDLGTGKLARVLRPEDGVNGLHFLADGRLVSRAEVATVWSAIKKP